MRLDYVNAHTVALSYGVDYSPDSFGLSGNRYVVGQALDTIQAAGTSKLFQSISAKFFAIPTDHALGLLYDSLSGEGAGGIEQTAFETNAHFLGSATDALAAWRAGRADENGPWSAHGTSLWAQAYGGGGDLRGRTSDNSFDLSYGGGGLAAGAQHAFGASLLAGLAVATDQSSYSEDGTSGRADGTHVMGYAGVRANGLYGMGVVSGDFFNLKTDRSFSAFGEGELIRGQTHGHSLSALAEVGYDFTLHSLTMTPFAGVQASTLWMDGYTETTITGPDLFPLAFAARDTRSVQSSVGLQIAPSADAPPSPLRPYVRLEWRHEFDPTRGVTPTFADFSGAEPFEILGARAASNLARMEAGLDWTVSTRTVLFAGVSGQFGQGQADASGHAGVRVSW